MTEDYKWKYKALKYLTKLRAVEGGVTHTENKARDVSQDLKKIEGNNKETASNPPSNFPK